MKLVKKQVWNEQSLKVDKQIDPPRLIFWNQIWKTITNPIWVILATPFWQAVGKEIDGTS